MTRKAPRAALAEHISQRVENLFVQLEVDYKRERQEAAERLHNAFVDVINEQRPRVETVLYVIEMLKVNLLNHQVTSPFGPAAEVVREEKDTAEGEGSPGHIGHEVMVI